MSRILIGNIKGPMGQQGKQGIQGTIGPVGPQGPLPPLTNTALATVAGVSALDAVMGKTLQDQITKANSDLAVSGGDIDITGQHLNAGYLTYQNIGRSAHMSFRDLQLKNSFPPGTTIKLFMLAADGRPLVTTKSVLVATNTPLYLTIATTGEIILGNYSGAAVPAGAIVEGQVSFVIGK